MTAAERASTSQAAASPFLPLLAIGAAASSALALSALVFVFTDPMGNDVDAFSYAALALVVGLVGGAAVKLARRSLRESRPLRRVSIAALSLGIVDLVAVASFLVVAFVFPPFVRWLVFD